MPIKNYTTSVDFEKTIGEITKCLREHGVEKITTDYTDKIPTGVTFCVNVKGTLVAFLLPANYEGVLKSMQNSNRVPRKMCTKEQALRVSWRIVKDWVVAQMAIVEAEMVDMAEVFLPYAITKNGTTLYKEIQNNGMKLLTA